MRLLPVLALVLPCAALAASPIELTQDEFKMFRHWQKAMSDPRVEKIDPSRRDAAIARDAHFKLKDLERAIAKAEAAGDVKSACETNLNETLAAGGLAGRIAKVDVDIEEPHAVAYVQWQNENVSQLEEEASLIAAITARQCPIVSTIQIWAQDKANPSTRVFQGLISRSAAAKINQERAKDFADTRYIRLFEQVKNIAAGDAMNESGDAASAGGSGGPTGGQQ